jgi:hypothetical protein
MSNNQDTSCNLCKEIRYITPVTIYNRPGLSTISYRVGVFDDFKRTIINNISRSSKLLTWTSRQPTDFGIVLTDIWAYLADILTFYQERIANEAFLRTAVHRNSIISLASMLDYRLNPGAAASTYLAFFLENDMDVTIPLKLKVQSIPLKEEEPQIFETIESIEAKKEIEILYPNIYETQNIKENYENELKQFYIKGIENGLKPGDAILFVWENDPRKIFFFLDTVTPFPDRDYTLVTWLNEFDNDPELDLPDDNPNIFVFRQRALVFGHNAPDWKLLPIDIKEQYVTCSGEGATDDPDWPDFDLENGYELFLDALYPDIEKNSWIVLFDGTRFKEYVVKTATPDSKPRFGLSGQTTKLITTEEMEFIDSNDNIFTRRNTIVYVQSEQLELSLQPKNGFFYDTKIELESLISGLKIDQPLIVQGINVKEVQIGESEVPIQFINESDESERPVRNDEIFEVAGPHKIEFNNEITWYVLDENKEYGHITGTLDQIIPIMPSDEDPKVGELLYISNISESEEFTTIIFKDPPENVYPLEMMEIFGNVAESTHGETIPDEILGDGDASYKNQKFTPKKSPVTYLHSPNSPLGIKNTLEIRVDRILWNEVRSFYGQDPTNKVYITNIDDEKNMNVCFGDGITGARLTTGVENIVATYRTGIGSIGNVLANQLQNLLDKPIGLASVTNPIPAIGGTDKELEENAKTNIPNTVKTFQRAISLKDYEDLAREYTGIAKAKAIVIRPCDLKYTNNFPQITIDYEFEEIILLTIAGDKGEIIDSTSSLQKSFMDYLNLHRDYNHKVKLLPHDFTNLKLKVYIQIDPAYIQEDVLNDAKSAILEYFNFENMQLGCAIHLSNVYSLLQKLSGVIAVKFEYFDEKIVLTPELKYHIPISSNSLASIDEEDIILEVKVFQ